MSTGRKRLAVASCFGVALVRFAIARLPRAALLGFFFAYFVRAITRGVWRWVGNVWRSASCFGAALVRCAIARLARAALLGVLLAYVVRAITREVCRRVGNVCVLRPASGSRSCVA